MAASLEIPTKMKAWIAAGYLQNPQDLKLVDDFLVPKPGKGEVLLRVEAASINPVDWKILKGFIKPFLPTKFPYVPVSDVAGKVVEVGPGVTKLSVGDEVFGMAAMGGLGSLAQFTNVRESAVAKRPQDVSPVEAAALPIAAGTAFQSLVPRVGRLMDGSYSGNVLITAASGGVGHYAVQLAKLAGAHVTATAGARNLEFVKKLGADEVLDYNSPEGQALTSPSGKKYDVVVDGTPGLPWKILTEVLAPEGRHLHLTPGPSGMGLSLLHMLTFSRQRSLPILMVPKTEDFEVLVALVKDKKLKTTVDTTFSFEKANEALAKNKEGHTVGKIVIDFSASS